MRREEVDISCRIDLGNDGFLIFFRMDMVMECGSREFSSQQFEHLTLSLPLQIIPMVSGGLEFIDDRHPLSGLICVLEKPCGENASDDPSTVFRIEALPACEEPASVPGEQEDIRDLPHAIIKHLIGYE